MVDSAGIVAALKQTGVRFVSGVPDSVLAEFSNEVDRDPGFEHVIAACEGGAVAMAAGNWIATGRMPCAYMQNSGLPNALNPLMTLLSESVLNTPMLLVIGWRGRPGSVDEPQHRLTGAALEHLLAAADVRAVRADDLSDLQLQNYMRETMLARRRGAILVLPCSRAGQHAPSPGGEGLEKRAVLRVLLAGIGRDDCCVAGLGHTAREVLALRGCEGDIDLPAVGGMGFAFSLAAGVALGLAKGRVYLIDGDGSFLMHAGNAAIVGPRRDLPLTHIVLANGCHASVGGQPLANAQVDYVAVARGLGFPSALSVATLDDLELTLARYASGAACLIKVPIRPSFPEDLPRPRDALSSVADAVARRLRATGND
ncbi:MAG: thiamine pyrophosphate-dependent enzyme [Vitreimonas sp.]